MSIETANQILADLAPLLALTAWRLPHWIREFGELRRERRLRRDFPRARVHR